MTSNEAPTWDQYMLPALRILADGNVHRARYICNAAADLLNVSAEEREVLIPSGRPRWGVTLLVDSRYQEGTTRRDVIETQEVHPGVQG